LSIDEPTGEGRNPRLILQEADLMIKRMRWLIFAILTLWTLDVQAQEFVVFKVYTPFDMGDMMPDSGRVNDYYVKFGSSEGAQIGTTMNVYRDRDILSDIGNFVVKDRLFIGRMRAINAHPDYCVARVSNLADYADPHRVLSAILIGDYVQPVFVVESETLFEKGSNILLPEAIRALDRAISFIQRFQPIKVRVEGHTDSGGDADYNMTLSQGRANSVKEYLVSQGDIEEEVLVPVGYGEGKPIASNDTVEGQRKNRRFEIVIEK